MIEQQEELIAPDKRLPGQDFGNPMISFMETTRVGHKADADAFTRTRKKTYLRKIKKQRNLK